jgi:hypothetical protein
MRRRFLARVLLLNGTLFLALISLQISVFFAVNSFRVNELLSGLFFQLFLQLIGGVLLTVFTGKNNLEKAIKESEKARLFIRGLSEEKKTDITAKSGEEKVDNGSILPYRDGVNPTKGGFDFVGADELTLNAKKKSSTTIDKENTLKAERILERVKNGEQINKREIESAVDSLIKVVSSKR